MIHDRQPDAQRQEDERATASITIPRLPPAAVVHDPSVDVDELLADFAFAIRERGFRVAGFVRLNHGLPQRFADGPADENKLLDLCTGKTGAFSRQGSVSNGSQPDHVTASITAAIDDRVDLLIISGFSEDRKVAGRLTTIVEKGIAAGIPILTSITGHRINEWHRFAGCEGAMVSPDPASLWRWWGGERLYHDLALGVPDVPVRRIVCGPRWLMIECATGTGLAMLPDGPTRLTPRLPALRGMSLRALADFTESWDPLEMAVGMAAINAHYNCSDSDLAYGNGVQTFRAVSGRVVAIGAFPGLGNVLPHAQVIETQPRHGELPTLAMDTVLPGCAAATVSSSSIATRTLPRILRLTQGARIALVGPASPMTPRLHAYGIEIVGGLRVRNPDGLAEAIAGGGLPRDFIRFGEFVHVAMRAEKRHPAPLSSEIYSNRLTERASGPARPRRLSPIESRAC